jgi:hypothetical protein
MQAAEHDLEASDIENYETNKENMDENNREANDLDSSPETIGETLRIDPQYSWILKNLNFDQRRVIDVTELIAKNEMNDLLDEVNPVKSVDSTDSDEQDNRLLEEQLTNLLRINNKNNNDNYESVDPNTVDEHNKQDDDNDRDVDDGDFDEGDYDLDDDDDDVDDDNRGSVEQLQMKYKRIVSDTTYDASSGDLSLTKSSADDDQENTQLSGQSENYYMKQIMFEKEKDFNNPYGLHDPEKQITTNVDTAEDNSTKNLFKSVRDINERIERLNIGINRKKHEAKQDDDPTTCSQQAKNVSKPDGTKNQQNACARDDKPLGPVESNLKLTNSTSQSTTLVADAGGQSQVNSNPIDFAAARDASQVFMDTMKKEWHGMFAKLENDYKTKLDEQQAKHEERLQQLYAEITNGIKLKQQLDEPQVKLIHANGTTDGSSLKTRDQIEKQVTDEQIDKKMDNLQSINNDLKQSSVVNDSKLMSNLRLTLKTKHSRHIQDLKSYYEQEIDDLKKELQHAHTKLR